MRSARCHGGLCLARLAVGGGAALGLALTGVLAARAAAPPAPSGPGLLVGPNVNMVGGPAHFDPGPPLSITGDPFVQRQNEVSLACSSRNALTCLAAANDYRTVDVPGLPEDRETGDAWLGVFWTRSGGQTWHSTLLPGFPQDSSNEGLFSPISGFQAAADPTVKAGTNGLLYISGIAFDREPASTSSSGVGGKSGAVFVATYIDDNNTEDSASRPRHVRTMVAAEPKGKKFLDKPWIAVDIPRSDSGACMIPGQAGVPDQTVPAGTIYLAYTVFNEKPNKVESELMVTRSTDCGATWDKAVTLSGPGKSIHQSANLAIHPQSGDLFVAWREFDSGKKKSAGRILVARSIDSSGKKKLKFTTPLEIAHLGSAEVSLAFDLPTLPSPEEPGFRMLRTNAYPSMCIDGTGLAHLAWAQRGVGPEGDSRVLIVRSLDGAAWSAPVPIDNHSGRGHQFMPALACSANRVTAVWYDQRNDDAALFGPGAFGFFVADPIPPPPTHTVDVRAAQGIGGGFFGPSTQVSKYKLAFDLSSDQLFQIEFNAENLPLFAGGTLPFLGDYIDLALTSPFDPPSAGGGWTFHQDPLEAPVLHAAWADNRDVPPNPADDWLSWAAPGTPACGTGVLTTTRNQNIYTARLSSGIMVGAPGNNRPLDGAVQRAFPVFVRNLTAQTRRFLLMASQPPGGKASFRQHPLENIGDAPLAQVEVVIEPQSSAARTVFANSTVPAASITVEIVEIAGPGGPAVPSGLRGSVVLNPDPTAPPPADPSVAALDERHNVVISPATLTTFANPASLSPTFINLSPTFLNPTFVTLSPTFLNPTFLTLSPTFLNPAFTSLSPTFLNEPVVTELTWTITNTGNVTTVFDLRTFMPAIPPEFIFQLMIYRLFESPAVNPANPCVLQSDQSQELLVSVVGADFVETSSLGSTFLSRNFSTEVLKNGVLEPGAGHPTIAIAPGDSLKATMQVVGPTTFPASTVQVVVTSTAIDSLAAAAGSTVPPSSTVAPTPSASPFRAAHTATLLPAATGNPATAGKILVTGGTRVIRLDTAGLLDPATGLFSGTQSLSEQRLRHTATPLPDGTVLVAGGFDSGGGFSSDNTAQTYNPLTATFAAPITMTAERGVHAASALATGEVLITGGQNAGGFLASAEVYHPSGLLAGTFTPTTGSMATARARHTSTLLNSGKVLVAGGRSSAAGVESTADLYDPGTGLFAPIPPTSGAMTTPRLRHTANLILSGPSAGKVLLAGGFGTGPVLASAELYDPASNSFSAVPGMHHPRADHTATSLPSNRILFMGGFDDTTTLAGVEVYDPIANFFFTLPPLAAARTGHTATLLPDGRVQVIGGSEFGETAFPLPEIYTPFGVTSAPRVTHAVAELLDGRILSTGGSNANGVVDSADLYDPTTGTLAPTGDMNEVRFRHTATTLTTGPNAGKVLIAGGRSGAPAVALDTAELYDPAFQTFSALLNTLETPRGEHTATRLNDGRVLLVGGRIDAGDPGTPTDTAEIYDPATGAFTFTTGNMTMPRRRHSATLLSNGMVLVAGGATTPNTTVSSAEIYDPAAGTFAAVPGGMADARRSHEATLLQDGRVLVTGGIGPGGLLKSSAETYEPPSAGFPQGRFVTTDSLTDARTFHEHTLLPSGKVLILGGWGTASELGSVEIFDPVADTMTVLPTGLAVPRGFLKSVRLAGGVHAGKLLIIGGADSSETEFMGPELYMPPP